MAGAELGAHPAHPEGPVPVVAPRPPRTSTQGGRYRRWHLETRAEAEEEGWLLTYLDVITLMLVMMVVMLSQAGPPGAGAAPAAADPATAQAADPPPAPTPAPAQIASAPSIVPPLPLPVPAVDPRDAFKPSPLDALGQDIEVLRSPEGVRFRIQSELMFGAGAAELGPQGMATLDRLVPVLQAEPGLRLVIEGHTDNSPVRGGRFPSNWELSASRAGAVARYLVGRGVAPQHLQATGYADTRPIAAQENPVDRGLNRRVELIMETSAPVR
jgi:chemotaxis protein MotB